MVILLVILMFAGIAFLGLLVAIFVLTTGNRSIIIDAEIKEDKHEKDADTTD